LLGIENSKKEANKLLKESIDILNSFEEDTFLLKEIAKILVIRKK